MWQIEKSQPSTQTAVYFFALPVDGVVLNNHELTNAPLRYYGNLQDWLQYEAYDKPVIPLDAHNVICLNWASPEEIVKNMEYLDDTVRAAIALIT